jgi:alkylation response protein AidB-like acyl-CoA dehydrogenase
MVARTYAAESLVYRIAGLFDAALDGSNDGGALARTFEEYAIESSIAKVTCSETLDYVLDENVQIHGGNGYVKDYAAERYYRDARVNRIFEGTNEINRLLIAGMVVRRGLKGEVPLVPAARRLQDEILAAPSSGPLREEAALAAETAAVAAFRKTALIVVGTAMQTYGESLTDEQEVLGGAADILIDTFAADSAVLRAREAIRTEHSHARLHEAAARVFVNGAAGRIELRAREALAAMAEGDGLRTLLAALRRVLKVAPANTVLLRRELAAAVTERGGYILNL